MMAGQVEMGQVFCEQIPWHRMGVLQQDTWFIFPIGRVVGKQMIEETQTVALLVNEYSDVPECKWFTFHQTEEVIVVKTDRNEQ